MRRLRPTLLRCPFSTELLVWSRGSPKGQDGFSLRGDPICQGGSVFHLGHPCPMWKSLLPMWIGSQGGPCQAPGRKIKSRHRDIRMLQQSVAVHEPHSNLQRLIESHRTSATGGMSALEQACGGPATQQVSIRCKLWTTRREAKSPVARGGWSHPTARLFTTCPHLGKEPLKLQRHKSSWYCQLFLQAVWYSCNCTWLFHHQAYHTLPDYIRLWQPFKASEQGAKHSHSTDRSLASAPWPQFAASPPSPAAQRCQRRLPSASGDSFGTQLPGLAGKAVTCWHLSGARNFESQNHYWVGFIPWSSPSLHCTSAVAKLHAWVGVTPASDIMPQLNTTSYTPDQPTPPHPNRNEAAKELQSQLPLPGLTSGEALTRSKPSQAVSQQYHRSIDRSKPWFNGIFSAVSISSHFESLWIFDETHKLTKVDQHLSHGVDGNFAAHWIYRIGGSGGPREMVLRFLEDWGYHEISISFYIYIVYIYLS